MPDTKRFTQSQFDILIVDTLAIAHVMTQRSASGIDAFVSALPPEMAKGIREQLDSDASIAATCIYLIMHAIETGIVSYTSILEKIAKDHGTVGAAKFEKRIANFKEQWEAVRPQADFVYSPPAKGSPE